MPDCKNPYLGQNISSPLIICCLSTTGLDGYPNARFVSLKEVTEESFVITGPINSRKGHEVEHNPKASLTFWWTITERQIRIQGDVSKITDAIATTYFEQRNRASKIVSNTFRQGEEIESVAYLKNNFQEQKEKLENKAIKRPENWGGISIKPIRIEFMEFKENRLHERRLFKRNDTTWKSIILQP
ncbi:pyridoxal 5'-phosphate synthase [uncultured Croceitalea sp.]|uniref:pyridoxine/pyridoxamine 5'-phosphate oxidase n=1 Tax=uncultured Croceitalea sp. TaxID=1798908 RepID=UPI00374F2DCD